MVCYSSMKTVRACGMKTPRVQINISAEMKKRLQTHLINTGVGIANQSAWIVDAVEKELEREEKRYAARKGK